jgi:hypothetical protein
LISNLRQSKLHNFELLEPTLKTLKIRFDPDTANAIMHGQKGEAIKILYQIKMVTIIINVIIFLVVGEKQQEVEVQVGLEEDSSSEGTV